MAENGIQGSHSGSASRWLILQEWLSFQLPTMQCFNQYNPERVSGHEVDGSSDMGCFVSDTIAVIKVNKIGPSLCSLLLLFGYHRMVAS